MSDPYRITIDPQNPNGPNRSTDQAPAGKPRGFLRTLTWVVLVISAVGNSVSSFGGVPTAVHLAFGVVSAICIGALIVQYVHEHR